MTVRRRNDNGNTLGLKKVKVRAVEDMAAFDRLPEIMRDVIRNYPVNISAAKALDQLETRSADYLAAHYGKVADRCREAMAAERDEAMSL